MAKQNYIMYQKTNPFPGWLRMVGHADPNQTPDGSTLAERLTALKTKYPDSEVVFEPFTEVLPDPEAVKYDVATQALVALGGGDITPTAQEILDKAQKTQDISDNLPSWAAIESAFNSIRTAGAAATTISALKSVLASFLNLEEKHTRITYWLAKNSKN